jgi:hypothetical protein
MCVCARVYRQISRQTDRQTDRQANRERDTHTLIHIHIHIHLDISGTAAIEAEGHANKIQIPRHVHLLDVRMQNGGAFLGVGHVTEDVCV